MVPPHFRIFGRSLFVAIGDKMRSNYFKNAVHQLGDFHLSRQIRNGIFMDYSKIHKDTYDALADEYEERVDTLLPVTQEAISYFSSHVASGGNVLEVGCGVGLAVKLLAEQGFAVTGIELAPKMADYAKKRNPHAAIVVGDFLTTDFHTTFDGIFAFAFIHLFPKADAVRILDKMYSILRASGALYIGTTESSESTEGWETKEDYSGTHKRFRKHWTEVEFRDALECSGFGNIVLHKIPDPFGKVWMDFTAKK